MAAIASVSRVELITRTAEETLGNSLTLEGGEIVEEEPAGCPLGTTMVVRDLFYNTPARLKFMKRDAAEGAAVFALVQKLALSHPEVSIKFLRDGKQDLLTPGDGNLQSALYSVLGRDMALGFVPVQGGAEDVTVTGFVSLPACCRGSRNQQFFFVNGRQVKSKLLMAALERAYENQKMVGKFPGCALQLQLKANAVDVNVHPAKTEVKFLYERKVFDGVYYTVLAALNGENRHPDLVFPEQKKTESVQMSVKTPPAASTANPSAGGGFQRMSAQQFREGQTLRDPAAAALLRILRAIAVQGRIACQLGQIGCQMHRRKRRNGLPCGQQGVIHAFLGRFRAGDPCCKGGQAGAELRIGCGKSLLIAREEALQDPCFVHPVLLRVSSAAGPRGHEASHPI